MSVSKYYLLLYILVVAVPFGLALNDLMALQGNVKQNGIDLASGNLTVVIYDAYSGGNLVYNSTNDFLSNISNVKYDVLLGNVSPVLYL